MLVKYLERTCIVLLLSLFLLLLLEIILRTLFSLSIAWSYEVARIIMVWIVFLGGLLSNIKREHIVISLFSNNIILKFFRMFIEKFIYFITSLFSIYFLLIIIPFYQVSSTTGLPQWINYTVIPLVFIISFFMTYRRNK